MAEKNLLISVTEALNTKSIVSLNVQSRNSKLFTLKYGDSLPDRIYVLVQES